MSEMKAAVEKLVEKELESANQRFPMFRSDHEGAAVLCEEIQEAEYEFECIKDRFKDLWESVKHNLSSEWITETNVVIMNRAVNLACEAIQVAAMAQKFIDSQKERRMSNWQWIVIIAIAIIGAIFIPKDYESYKEYKKKDTKEHMSTMDKDYRLVREFIKSQSEQNNAQRIRNMTDEELAKFLADCSDCASCYLDEPNNCGTEETCAKAFLEWLKQPVED